MAARFIVRVYTNRTGNERASVLMSSEDARLLAVGDRETAIHLGEAITKQIEDDDAE